MLVRLNRIAAFALAACMTVSVGCGNGSAGNLDKDTTAETVAPTVSPAADDTEDIEGVEEDMYFKECSEKLEEKAHSEILKRREGVTYPRFEAATYYSTTAERETPVNVLLPQDYSEDKKYPVVYVLHGYWCDQNQMTAENMHIAAMLTNLIADGEAEEMIVVSPYIYCSKEQAQCTAMDTANTLAYDNFINDLTTDLMPFIEENYSVAVGKENTAITGFSMGGREALYIGFTYPDRFGYIGAACPAPGVISGTGEPHNLEREDFCFTDNLPYLVMISAGTKDNVVGDNPKIYHEALEQNGTQHLWHEVEGTGHDGNTVTPHLYNFFRMAFKA